MINDTVLQDQSGKHAPRALPPPQAIGVEVDADAVLARMLQDEEDRLQQGPRARLPPQVTAVEVDGDAALAKMLQDEEEEDALQHELRCINDREIAAMFNDADIAKAYYEPLKKLQTTSRKNMTIEELAAYHHLHGAQKYIDVGEENDFYVVQKKKPPNVFTNFRFADKKKGEEYAVVVSPDGTRVTCEFLDRQRRICHKSYLFATHFEHVSRGDGVLISVRNDKPKLVFRYTHSQWDKISVTGTLNRWDGLNKMPIDVIAHILDHTDLHSSWFYSLRLVNSVFRDIVVKLVPKRPHYPHKVKWERQ